MSAMYTIEVADGEHAAPMPGAQVVQSVDDFHNRL